MLAVGTLVLQALHRMLAQQAGYSLLVIMRFSYSAGAAAFARERSSLATGHLVSSETVSELWQRHKGHRKAACICSLSRQSLQKEWLQPGKMIGSMNKDMQTAHSSASSASASSHSRHAGGRKRNKDVLRDRR